MRASASCSFFFCCAVSIQSRWLRNVVWLRVRFSSNVMQRSFKECKATSGISSSGSIAEDALEDALLAILSDSTVVLLSSSTALLASSFRLCLIWSVATRCSFIVWKFRYMLSSMRPQRCRTEFTLKSVGSAHTRSPVPVSAV
eukprot:CAMPEP_0180781184 /NCGR_PEP_ID=MMETSP1038_2-20121128/47490_1 /TAXON_ID=632150 /ORGANISM="Azadinium spinosum, Strain 3D9" /LENGTH=142 /DNA_ID=CAMNT_0022816939 /DNA_START=8 /DNA_END=436 /DNA_ORIENTATION=-